MAYTKVFDNPYPNGWVDAPSIATPLTAAALQEHTDAIEHIEDYLANGGGGGGTGSSVSWNQIKTSGEKIATVTIDGTSTDVYASAGGSGGSVTWGSITGTLADQTDLKNALNLKTDNTQNGAKILVGKLPAETADLTDDDVFAVTTNNSFIKNKISKIYDYIKSKLTTDGIKAVAWNQKTTSGTNIATITIDGVATEIYAPTSGGGGGDSVWGGITGTLSDQTDLQTALNGKLTTTNLGNALYNLTSDTATVADGTRILSSGSGGTYYNRSALSLYNYIKSKILADKKIFEDEHVLSGTESTTYTFTDNAITEDSMINVYAEYWGENPSSVAVVEHTCTVIFPPSSDNPGYTMKCRITLEEGV